jgi:hypothetical protein
VANAVTLDVKRKTFCYSEKVKSSQLKVVCCIVASGGSHGSPQLCVPPDACFSFHLLIRASEKGCLSLP